MKKQEVLYGLFVQDNLLPIQILVASTKAPDLEQAAKQLCIKLTQRFNAETARKFVNSPMVNVDDCGACSIEQKIAAEIASIVVVNMAVTINKPLAEMIEEMTNELCQGKLFLGRLLVLTDFWSLCET